MIDHVTGLLLWFGAIGVPAIGLFAIFISTLGAEKPTDKPVMTAQTAGGFAYRATYDSTATTTDLPTSTPTAAR